MSEDARINQFMSEHPLGFDPAQIFETQYGGGLVKVGIAKNGDTYVWAFDLYPAASATRDQFMKLNDAALMALHDGITKALAVRVAAKMRARNKDER